MFSYRYHFQGKCGKTLPDAVAEHPSEQEAIEHKDSEQ